MLPQTSMSNMDEWKHYTASALFQSWNKVYFCTEYQFLEPPSLWCNLCGLGMTNFGLLWPPRNFVLSTISIFTLLMITSIDIDTRTLFRWNKMKCVFFKFKDNLFIWSQLTTLTISSFIVLIRSSWSFPDKNIFESSAKSNENNF